METIKIVKKAVLIHLIDPSNLGDDKINIFLNSQLFADTTNKNFGFRYTTAYGTSHHGVTPFSVPSLDPTTMAQLDISKQAEDGATMITVADKKNAAKGTPPPLPASYT